MSVSRRHLISLGLGATALAAAGAGAKLLPATSVHAEPVTSGPAPDAAHLALQRLAHGPSPEDLAKIQRMGLSAYIEEQLAPGADDGPTVARIAASITFPLALPVDREEESMDETMMAMESMDMMEGQGRQRGKGKQQKQQQRQKQGQQQGQGQQERQRPQYEQVPTPLEWWNAPLEQRWTLVTEYTQEDRPLQRRPGQEVRVMSVLRAMHSPWQLREVLVEFWHNHFNVDLEADRRIPVVFPDHDAAIRQHALGNFRELLQATAESPAMLYYLNNAQSKASPANENYARELFELHTLGEVNYLNRQYRKWDQVPGASAGEPVGYVDEDVYEAARAFTGWTVADGGGLGRRQRITAENQGFPNTGAFHYQAAWHDPYQKRVLGRALDPNQPPQQDGAAVLDMLAEHPGTAQYVCTKLVRRLVADDPPAEVVAAAVQTWRAKLHDPQQLREVVKTIVTHPRFAQGWGGKVKNPREFTVSYLRGIGAEFSPMPQLFRIWEQLGYRQFAFPAPTGHPDIAGAWLSTNGMLGRWNLLLAMSQPRFGATFDVEALTPSASRSDFTQATRYWAQAMIGTPLPAASEQAIVSAVQASAKRQGAQNDPYHFLTTLIAMTPEFQRR